MLSKSARNFCNAIVVIILIAFAFLNTLIEMDLRVHVSFIFLILGILWFKVAIMESE